MGYIPLEELAADAGFEVFGESLEELFRDAAKATFSLMVDPESITPEIQIQIQLESSSLEGLLVDWLNELLFMMDAQGLIFKDFQLELQPGYKLRAIAAAQRIGAQHRFKCYVKAATYHLLQITQQGGRWSTKLVLDL